MKWITRARLFQLSIGLALMAIMFGILLYRHVEPNLAWDYNVKQAATLMNHWLIFDRAPIAPDLPGIALGLPQVKETSPQAIAAFDAVENHLTAAIKLYPNRALAYRLAGQMYAAKGQWQQAVHAFEQAYAHSARNPLMAWELVQSLEQVDPGSTQLKSLYATIGFSTPQFLTIADVALQSGKFIKADLYYRYAVMASDTGENNEQSFALLFRRTIAATLSNAPDSTDLVAVTQRQEPTFNVYSLTDNLQLDGAQLHWLTPIAPPTVTFGTALNYPLSGATGTFWWTGQGTALIAVQQTGNYQIAFHVQHRDPPPVQMALGVDGIKMQTVALTRGDNSWETVNLSVNVKKGFHSISLWFLNDEIVDRKNRDGAVQWIHLIRISR